MSEDPSQKMPDARSFEERVLSELTSIRSDIAKVDMRLTTLEDKVDARLRETRPIWEAMQATLEDIHSQMHEVVRDLYSMRGRISRLEDRERSPAA